MKSAKIRKCSATIILMFLLTVSVGAMAGGRSTSIIDAYSSSEYNKDFPYERTIFTCEINIAEPSGDEWTRITPQMNIIKVHHKDYRLQAIEANGEKSIFTGYGDDFKWSYFAQSYRQSFDNDWDAPWLEIELKQIKGRHYSGFIITPRDYYNDSETEVRYPMDCKFVDDLQTTASTTSLMQAAIYGDTSRLEILLNRNVDVNATDDNGYTALMYAIINGYSRSTSLLINAGADVDATNCFGNDALNYALSQGNQYLSWLLIQAGASGAAESLNGATALSLGLENGLFSFLVSQNVISNAGLVSAIEKLSLDQLQAILEFDVDVNAVDGRGNSALHLIAATQDIEKARVLIQAGAHLELENEWGATPLAIASKNSDTKMAIELLKNGAAVVKPGKYSPLHNALYSGNFDLANLMLETKDIDYAAIDNQGHDLLISATSFYARGKNQEAMAKKLLDRGANAAFVSADGNTALIQAALGNQLAVVKMLIANGANINSINGFNFTALGYARYYKYQAIVEVLLEAGADPSLGRQPLTPR